MPQKKRKPSDKLDGTQEKSFLERSRRRKGSQKRLDLLVDKTGVGDGEQVGKRKRNSVTQGKGRL